MTLMHRIQSGIVLAFALVVVACSGQPAADAPEAPSVVPQEAAEDAAPQAPAAEAVVSDTMLRSFAALPAVAESENYELNAALVDLGRMLYYDTRLSINQELSCNSCHALDAYGVDNEATSPGFEGVRGGRNSPTTYNAAVHMAQFWDGRAADVEEQAMGPITNPVEMGMPDGESVEVVLRSIPGYQDLFAEAFPDEPEPVTFENAAVAIGAFERGLLTPSRFDEFLAGTQDALTPEEQLGLATFVEVGCAACHNGAAIGGMMYQKMGLINEYETDDAGRAEVTGDPDDTRVFKVPSLRNITETAPYLHDGSVADLEEVIRIMGHYQVGQELTDEQVSNIAAFLEALTGEVPAEYIAEPELPESGPDTPAPQTN